MSRARLLFRGPPVGTRVDLKDYNTTGTIASAESTLTLASNPGFQIGDEIIVETGGESGGGLRGTKGVGGTWPALSYADAATMSADTSKANSTVAYTVDTGNVYQFATGTGLWTQQTSYYVAKAVPRALLATILDVDGLVITLDVSATVAASAANVYFDNAAILNALLASGATTPTNNTLILPAGRFAVSALLAMTDHPDWIIRGDRPGRAELFSPEGCPSFSLVVTGCDRATIQNFHYEGNARPEGFGLATTETSIPSGAGYPRGVYFVNCTDATAKDLRATDVWQHAVGTSNCTDVWAYRCWSIKTAEVRVYIQWEFLWASSVGGGCVDCVVESLYLIGGFETFLSEGVTFTRCRGLNCVASSNSSGNFLFDELNLVIAGNSQYNQTSFGRSTPMLNINKNFVGVPADDLVALGGAILNPKFTFIDYINADNDILIGIVVNANNPLVTVDGGYPNNPSAGGLIDYKVSYSSPSTLPGPQGVVSDNAGTAVTGIRVTGTTNSALNGNIKVGPTGSVTNCVADRIIGGTQTDNQTNEEYAGT